MLKEQDIRATVSDSSLQEHQIKVLLVDDQAMIGEAVRRMLATEDDIMFYFCSNPTQAIQMAVEIAPTVILQDLVMPDINGLLLLRFFRANPETRDIPIVMLSTKEDPKIKAEAFAFGANDYLVKLSDKIELIARIRYHSKAYINLLQRNEAYQAIQRTQAQLIQAEKMSSLGQLVAGVAHEINNPVNFIYGNLIHISKYFQHFLDLIDLYQRCYPAPQQKIQELTQEMDLEFLIEDVPKLLSSMEVGADRIRQIVLTLRNFSRLDEAEMKVVNIHEGIDSTLLILQNRLKGKLDRSTIQVITDYGELPEIECYAGQLNQVFMNVLSNAIDALHESDNQRSPEEIKRNPNIITIRSRVLDPNWVRISIIDNGPGMMPDVRSRLFEPFFTTKPVGKGTGLGLSISYQIVVEKHGGRIWCVSEPGAGSEFYIDLPRSIHSRNVTNHEQNKPVLQYSAV